MIDLRPNGWTDQDFNACIGVSPKLLYPVFRGVDDFVFKHRRFQVRVTSGMRTLAEQRQLLRLGKTKTLNSKHLDGQAIDLAILSADRSQAYWVLDYFELLNGYIQEAAISVGTQITWGGSWKMRDGPHWELA